MSEPNPYRWSNFCDVTIFANHPLFSQDPYYDEVEICNPLGNVKRHKLGITLGNIAPLYHSQLKTINLI